MDFMPQPDEAKKLGMKWLKYKIMKHPNIAIICLPIPVLVYKTFEFLFRYDRLIRTGVYVPMVVMNRYCIVRPTDYNAKITPSRYLN